MRGRDWVFLVGVLIIVFAVEITGAIFTASSVQTWYPKLIKPSWTPPSWIFGPVWTLLYISMALSLFLVWRKGISFKAYFFWALQLFLNFLWSLLFFQFKSPLLGLIDICFLWISLLYTLIVFGKHSIGAAWLLVPYFLWVSYALTINAGILWLNMLHSS